MCCVFLIFLIVHNAKGAMNTTEDIRDTGVARKTHDIHDTGVVRKTHDIRDTSVAYVLCWTGVDVVCVVLKCR